LLRQMKKIRKRSHKKIGKGDFFEGTNKLLSEEEKRK